MKHSLAVKGLSLSQAQSISNLCYQRALEIANQLSGINNAKKVVTIDKKDYETQVAKALPKDVVALLMEKAKLHGTQAFLMSNIKAKEQLLTNIRRQHFAITAKEPVRPDFIQPKLQAQVDENWGWDQLSTTELCEYLEHEAYAAHIGQFIHKDSVLDNLRKELPQIKSIEWLEVEMGKRTPVVVTPHHTSEQLLKVHEELAAKHRTHEMRVNYFKAKVKNLVTEENARIAKENAIEQGKVNSENERVNNDYKMAYKAYADEVAKEREEFEAKRQNNIKDTAALRIEVDARFQGTIDKYLNDLGVEEVKL